MGNIIGREHEKKTLNSIYISKQAELVAVYGRRRVGKTFLVKHYFQNKKCVYFHITGIKKGKLNVQLDRFNKIFTEVFYPDLSIKTPPTWMEAFDELTKAINKVPKSMKVVLFFDELPWLASRKSGVLPALEYFWNRHWVDDKRLKLILCGSSSSWMINKIIKNRGGLHNRITKRIRMMPLTLADSKTFLEHDGIKLSNKQLVKLYMAIGGIPYYLKQLEKNYSVDQNINKLFFNSDGLFFDEFDEVFFSLFDDAGSYKELVTLIAQSKDGILRHDLEKKNKLTGKGGYLSKRLNDLEASGFITSYVPFSHKKRGTYYRIYDEYCYFYLRWIDPVKSQLKRETNSHYWLSIINTPAYYNWAGYAYENICYKHISQIRKALNIPLAASGSPWSYSPTKDNKANGAQIDMLFDRPDNAITISEIKYTDKIFEIDKAYAENLSNKINVFQKITGIKKQLFLAIISASGIKKNKYSSHMVDGIVTVDDLFKED